MLIHDLSFHRTTVWSTAYALHTSHGRWRSGVRIDSRYLSRVPALRAGASGITVQLRGKRSNVGIIGETLSSVVRLAVSTMVAERAR